jgi:two-component system, OmpR family, sensor kinase
MRRSNQRSPKSLKTVSLRRRVAVSVIAVLAGTLVLVAFVVDAYFGMQSRRDLQALLKDRVTIANQLVKQKIAATQVFRQLQNRGDGLIKVRVVLPDGSELGSLPPPESQLFSNPRFVNQKLSDGSRLTVVGDTSVTTQARTRLRRALVVVGVSALALTTVILVGTVRLALAPLDAMTELARSIARGDRGRRLSPNRTDTELGRTAAAFDGMLDELEGAEQIARASEERTRRFVADAAHELRTPVAGVRAVAEAVLQAGPDADAAERERMNLLLVREAHRAARLVDDLLALAMIDAGLDLQHEQVDLLALATMEVERTRLLANGQTVEVEGEAVVVDGDAQRLAQVLANLLDNARRYTPGAGCIRLSVATVDTPAAGKLAELMVSDTGAGVPETQRERIFERLVRLDVARARSSGGAGLGLAIARGIARAHAGELTCEPPPPGEQGAVFRLVLPLPSTDPPTVRFVHPIPTP